LARLDGEKEKRAVSEAVVHLAQSGGEELGYNEVFLVGAAPPE